MPGLKNPDVLLTDTVGFIQKLPTNLIAAFRYHLISCIQFYLDCRVQIYFLSFKSATLEELSEADVLIVSISIHTCLFNCVYVNLFLFFFIHSTSRTSAMRLGESKRLPYWRNCRTWSAYSAVAQMIY